MDEGFVIKKGPGNTVKSNISDAPVTSFTETEEKSNENSSEKLEDE